jgi:flagellar basal body-associated protein FliL
MIILIKIALALFLIGWSGLGLWMLLKYDQLFGYHPDDPAESSGARALNVTQVSSVWFGFFAVAFYFLIR